MNNKELVERLEEIGAGKHTSGDTHSRLHALLSDLRATPYVAEAGAGVTCYGCEKDATHVDPQLGKCVCRSEGCLSSRWIGLIPLRVVAAVPERDGNVREAALALYMAGRWTCGRDDEAAMWERLRDALGLPVGTATAAGVAAVPERAPERCAYVFLSGVSCGAESDYHPDLNFVEPHPFLSPTAPERVPDTDVPCAVFTCRASATFRGNDGYGYCDVHRESDTRKPVGAPEPDVLRNVIAMVRDLADTVKDLALEFSSAMPEAGPAAKIRDRADAMLRERSK